MTIDQLPETPNFVDPPQMPRQSFMSSYYGHPDHPLARQSEVYHEMHPSFGGYGYRDHLPLSQAEKAQLVREE